MGHSHFDDRAHDWDDDPERVMNATQVAEAIRAKVPLTGSERMLEYGAGTGLVAQMLRPSVREITLADASAGMRAAAQRKVEAGVFAPDTRVWDLDLAQQSAPDEQFDLVVTSLVLHHIPDLAPVLVGFRQLVAPGGHVAIADLDTEDGSFHAHLHDFDGHAGFDRHALIRSLEEVGFRDASASDCSTIDKEGQAFPVFLVVAKG